MEQKIMKGFRAGCVVCGKPIEYFAGAKAMKCEICGESFDTNAACISGHYICDKCHAKKGLEFITEYALETVSKNPAAIACEMMKNGFINMHGPEHHYLIPAALLSAYKNSGGDIQLKPALEKALQRAKNVPGGVCGMWGSCGAGIATGIFVSIITGATPLSEKEWSLSNAMTSLALSEISKNGGPRCCKRNAYLAIRNAVDFVHKNTGIKMEQSDGIKCEFFPMNKQCRKSVCLYWHENF